VGINTIVSSGNETDLTAADLLDYLGNDPQTRVVLCYVEELRDGRRFAEAARRLTQEGKHVVAVKGGRSRAGSRAVQSHTGAMAGDDRVISAVFRETGVIRARVSRCRCLTRRRRRRCRAMCRSTARWRIRSI
jgi:acyl-CoA synthetase (NDP forming)